MTSNPRIAEATKAALAKLREGVAGPELAEMATEALDGRTDLRTIGQSSVYAAQLTEATEFHAWQADLSLEERETLDSSAHEQFEGRGPIDVQTKSDL